jgi:4-hydroxybenzoate polyprenyltransferase
MRESLGDRFGYIGIGSVDEPVFAAAEETICVGGPPLGITRRNPAIESPFPHPDASISRWIKALRLHHWAKNVLVFVAPILTLPLATLTTFVQATILFFAMGMFASATYIVNDMVDLQADRQHPRKRFRPFASGAIQLREGLLVASGFILAGALLALTLPASVAAVIAAYFVATLAYSLALKRIPTIDIVVLAVLFTLRVLAGSLLVPLAVSPWFLTFSMFFFLGLATVKRYTELDEVVRSGGSGIPSRGYTAIDLPLLLASGVASGVAAIVIFMIYLVNEHYPREVYGRPELLWAMMPLMFIWTLRLWHLTVHARMNDDPLVFALRDPFSLVSAALAGVVLVAAWL